jgi:hypothetical protein
MSTSPTDSFTTGDRVRHLDGTVGVVERTTLTRVYVKWDDGVMNSWGLDELYALTVVKE